MSALNSSAPYLRLREIPGHAFPHNPPSLNVSLAIHAGNPTIQTHIRTKEFVCITEGTRGNRRVKASNSQESNVEEIYEDEQDEEEREIENEFSQRRGFRGKEERKDFDKDPEFAEILGNYLDDPDKARSKVQERLRRKRNKILHTKAGSAAPMKVVFNKAVMDSEQKDFPPKDDTTLALKIIFDFSNSYIWFEFYNSPLEKDISLICDTIRSWHIVGRLGGCNSMNMQLSQSSMDARPSYDAVQGANVSPTTFYNIGDLEVQDNLARIWVDIGISEPLLLDIFVNALTQISTDYVGIKQVVFGGSEFENWRENLTTEDVGYAVHKI